MSKAKILYLDIETMPILAWVWGLFDQNIGLEMVKEDWRIISWSAKWADSVEVMQEDLRSGINDKNEKAMLKKIWALLNEAQIVVGQNSKKFDVKKLNEKFLHYGLGCPSPYKQIDTLTLSRKYFSPTSHKLEYRSKQLNKKYKKLAHSKYPGFSLWKACMNGEQGAWKEMATYNIFDVLATEEYHQKLQAWDNSINLNVYHDGFETICNCGSTKLQKRGYAYTTTGKYQRFQCTNCGTWTRDTKNMHTKEKRETLKRPA